MSTTAKTIFVASCIFTGIVVYKVHEYQDEERKVKTASDLADTRNPGRLNLFIK